MEVELTPSGGGSGNDTITGGVGADRINAGGGTNVIAFGAADTFGDTIVTYGTSAQNTTALGNAVISSAGINGDVLKFSLDKLDDIAGFTANAGFLATNPDAATKGTTVAATGLVSAAGARLLMQLTLSSSTTPLLVH